MSSRKVIHASGIIGLALFALFFGAGNLIFPPVIGLEGGTDWTIGYLSYFFADVGLALLGLAAMIKTDGKLEGVTGIIGKVPSIVLNCAMILCVGPLLAIPRTAATSFEMGTAALIPSVTEDPVVRIVVSVIFFAIVFFAVLHPGKIVAGIGKTLTPFLVIALAILIIAGIANPAAQTEAPRVANVLGEGILNGYQTMDMIAALVFSLVVVKTMTSAADKEKCSLNKLAFGSCGIAAALLFLTYGGLAFLGSTTGQVWEESFMAGEINQAGLLSNISVAVIGNIGAGVLALTVVLACLTTAIGLTSACSEFVVSLSKERIPYIWVALGMCVFSVIICNLGLTQIVAIAAPILSLVYPVAMFLVIMCLLPLKDEYRRFPSQIGAVVAFVMSACVLLSDMFGISACSFVHALPFDTVGFGWVIPTFIAALIGLAISWVSKNNREQNDLS